MDKQYEQVEVKRRKPPKLNTHFADAARYAAQTLQNQHNVIMAMNKAKQQKAAQILRNAASINHLRYTNG
ncbi:hypothetical protein KAR91_57315 [Candidatus Pacearchaeota archaeon]|nr:hypothetical protein [Candidatus Pacearchaeota archaeon]